jgi:cytochrome c2
MIGDFVHRSNIVSRLLIAASLALPASALAQPLEGNPLTGRQTAAALCAPCHQVGETRPRRPPELCGRRQYAFHHGSFFEGISSLKSQRDA